VSLGAGRVRILRQFLTESLLLSAAGTLLGLAAGRWFLLAWFTVADSRPLMWSLLPDSRVLGFAVCLVIVVAGVTGLVPALQASRTPSAGLKEGSAGARVSRTRAFFVGAEVAVCLLLLVLTGLLLRGSRNAGNVDPGMPVHQMLAAHLDAQQHGYEGERLAALSSAIQREIEALPAVRRAAVASPVPFSSSRSGTRIRTADAPDTPGTRVFTAAVSPTFFEAADLALVRGRIFDPSAPHEVVVNERLAREVWPGADPLGAEITIGDYQRERRTVVGVVRTTPFLSLRQGAEPFMFGSPANGPILVRTYGPAAAASDSVADAIRRIDAQLEPSISVLSAAVGEEIQSARHATTIAGLVGGLALLLALLGIGSVTSHIVVQRTHEVGVRMALGARGADAVWLLVRRSLRPVAAGMAVGVAATAIGSRVIASQLYGISPLDPVAFAGAAGLFLLVATLAAWVPARRAARIDPIVALRCE
jgi:predicted permease